MHVPNPAPARIPYCTTNTSRILSHDLKSVGLGVVTDASLTGSIRCHFQTETLLKKKKKTREERVCFNRVVKS